MTCVKGKISQLNITGRISQKNVTGSIAQKNVYGTIACGDGIPNGIGYWAIGVNFKVS